jgi:hypothetical protein
MALKGNLHDFSILQLLNLINLANKTGALYIEGPGNNARVIFREGKLCFADLGGSLKPLLQDLVEGKNLSSSQAGSIVARQRTANDKEMGIFLINAGYLSQDQIFTALEIVYADFVRQLFAWEEGFFHFEVGELTPVEKIPVRMDLENLIVEGARQLHELEELKNELPSLEMALKFTDRPGTNIRDVNLSVEEWRVVNYVNPKNTLQQIAKATHLNDLGIRRVVYALLQAGLVELVRPGGLPMNFTAKMFPTQDPVEQKSLVNRLITRIRSI